MAGLVVGALWAALLVRAEGLGHGPDASDPSGALDAPMYCNAMHVSSLGASKKNIHVFFSSTASAGVR